MQPWLWICQVLARRFQGAFVLTSQAMSTVSWCGLAPTPKWEQRELGEGNKYLSEPPEGCLAWRVWGERIHYNLGKSENTVVHRPFRLCNRWCCFGWHRRQVFKQLPEIVELQPAELKRVQRIRRHNTFTWRKEKRSFETKLGLQRQPSDLFAASR